MVLSYEFWHRHFDGDRDVLGRTLNLNGRPFTVADVVVGSEAGPLLKRAVPELHEANFGIARTGTGNFAIVPISPTYGAGAMPL